MYYNYNDYELIYLIQNGVEEALKELYNKYSHLLYKFYYQQENRYISKGDFLQEGYMVLQKALETYNEQKCISFYTYFSICLKRKIPRINSLNLEQSKNTLDYIKDNNGYSNITYVIFKELALESSELCQLFKYCVVRGMPIKTYSRLFNKEYEKTYYMYKKLIEKLRKKVSITFEKFLKLIKHKHRFD